jgi:hypothetical protein
VSMCKGNAGCPAARLGQLADRRPPAVTAK